MKQFKKAFLSFVLIFCSVILCACGSTPPPKAQIDTGASVNTSGTYTSATKEELTPYFDSTDEENYVGNQEITGLHTTTNMSVKLIATEITIDDVYEIYLKWEIESFIFINEREPDETELKELEDVAFEEATAYMEEYELLAPTFAALNNKVFMTSSLNSYQKFEDGFVTAMASKTIDKEMNMETFEMSSPLVSYEYFKDDVAYLDDGLTKYYLPKEDVNFGYIAEDLTFSPDKTFLFYVTGILENLGVVVTKATEGTTVKYKAVVEGETDQDLDAQLTLVLKDGNFNGLQFRLPDFDIFSLIPEMEFMADMFKLYGLTMLTSIETDIVAFNGTIDFPASFSAYNTLYVPPTEDPVE